MEKLNIKAKLRTKVGKSYCRKIRREGRIPAIIYKDCDSIPLEIETKDIIHLLHLAHLENPIVELEILDNKEKKTAILKDIQYDTLRGMPIHLDFQEIALEEMVRVKVPIELKGEAIGVKRDGGILEHLLREIEVECKAKDIPQKIEVKISSLEIGDAIHAQDLEIPDGIRLLEAPEQVIVHILAPKVEEEIVIEEEKEPEVIREKKTEEEKKEEM